MSNTVRDLVKFTTVTSSGGAAVSNTIGGLDDASSITIFFTSSASLGITSSASLMVTGWDASQPTVKFNMSSSQFIFAGNPTSSLTAMVLSNISFRSMQFQFTATSSTAGEVIAWVSKQVSV